MINHRAKADLAAAKRDFGEFLGRVEPGRFTPQVHAAETWLGEIDRVLGFEGVDVDGV
jgi:hypothetical protein